MTSPRESLIESPCLCRPLELLSGERQQPTHPGLYAWYFDRLPDLVPTQDCVRHRGRVLAYIGISPSRPTKKRASGKRQTVWKRLQGHLRNNASGSTLRLTLGCLLADELGLELRPTPSGRLTFGTGEDRLSDWLDSHARLAFVRHATPWTVERSLIRSVSLPLNLRDNDAHPFHETLSALRARHRQLAKQRS